MTSHLLTKLLLHKRIGGHSISLLPRRICLRPTGGYHIELPDIQQPLSHTRYHIPTGAYTIASYHRHDYNNLYPSCYRFTSDMLHTLYRMHTYAISTASYCIMSRSIYMNMYESLLDCIALLFVIAIVTRLERLREERSLRIVNVSSSINFFDCSLFFFVIVLFFLI